MRSSDPALLGRRPSVTSVELIWRVPPPLIPAPRPRATPVAMPSMHDLTAMARRLAAAPSLPSGAARLARDVGKLLRLADVACMWIDWPHGCVHTPAGTLDARVAELVMSVAGSGRRSLVDNTLVEPLGPRPARAVLALRKPAGIEFDAAELTVIQTLAIGLAPTIDRLIIAHRAI